MSYIEEFLEMNSSLPRETVRILKLIREIDEKIISNDIFNVLQDNQKNLQEQRKKFTMYYKTKNKNEKIEQDLLKQIDKEHENLIYLSNHKIELVNEANYLIEYHSKKLNEIIENFEKYLQNTNSLNPMLTSEYQNSEKAPSVVDDSISIAGSSNIYTISLLEKKTDNISIKDKIFVKPPYSASLISKKRSN
jgi:hypothetical protein